MAGPSQKDLQAILQEEISRHGHGFQAAAARICGSVSVGQFGQWQLATWEHVWDLPNGRTGRIDFTLRLPCQELGATILVVVECKRVNPAFGRWVFARSPYGPNGRTDVGRAVVETILCDSASYAIAAPQVVAPIEADLPYDIGYQFKTTKTGDAQGSSTDAIEDATTQVLRGCAGLARDVAIGFKQSNQRFIIVPLVLTTAALSAVDIRLTDTDLATGKVELPVESSRQCLLYTARPSGELIAQNEESVLIRRIREIPDDLLSSKQMASHTRTVWIANALNGAVRALEEIVVAVARSGR